MRVAQPSLSQQIKKLETELGRPLFDRLPRGAVPTEAGARLVEHAKRILAQLRDAEREVMETRETVSGILRVGAIPTVAPYLIPRAVEAFRASWPDVEIQIREDVTERLCDAVVDGQLDLAVMSSIEDSRAVHVDVLGVEKLWALVPADGPLSKRKSMSWSAFGKQSALVLDPAHCLAGQMSKFCRVQGAAPSIAANGAQLQTIAAMVSSGLGVSMVPDMMRAHDEGAPGRVYLPFTGAKPSREITAVWSLLRYRTNAAREFQAVLTDQLAKPA